MSFVEMYFSVIFVLLDCIPFGNKILSYRPKKTKDQYCFDLFLIQFKTYSV